MPQTLYATFNDATQCEQAAGALLDYGVRKEDLSLVAHETFIKDHPHAHLFTGAPVGMRQAGSVTPDTSTVPGFAVSGIADPAYAPSTSGQIAPTGGVAGAFTGSGTGVQPSAYSDPVPRSTATESTVGTEASQSDVEQAAKQGISVTTPADAGAGAAKGAGVGLGLGTLAAITSLMIPGVGLVTAGGALAVALAGALGATAAGAAAGGVVGYLKDQGVPSDAAARYSDTLTSGGAMLAVTVPSNNIDGTIVQGLLTKYGATNVNVY